MDNLNCNGNFSKNVTYVLRDNTNPIDLKFPMQAL